MNTRQIVFCRDGVLRLRQKHIDPTIDFAIPLSEIESMSRTGILSTVGASHISIEKNSNLLSVISCLQPWSDVFYESNKIDINSWLEDFAHSTERRENFINIRLSKKIDIHETDKILMSETWEVGIYHDDGHFMGDFIDFPPDITGRAKFQRPTQTLLNNTVNLYQLPIIDPAHPKILNTSLPDKVTFCLPVEKTDIGFSDFVINGLLTSTLRYTTPLDAFLISCKKHEKSI